MAGIIPTQLVLPGFGRDDSPRPKACEASHEVCEASHIPIAGQLELFALAMPKSTSDGRRKASPTEIGDAGQALFRAICSATPLGYMQPVDPGHEGFDCYVEERRVQVKTSSKTGPRIWFNAGSAGRFDHYRGKCDIFVFVIADRDSELYGRMRLMEAGTVIGRWPGPRVVLKPSDFPTRPNLELLAPRVTDLDLADLILASRLSNA